MGVKEKWFARSAPPKSELQNQEKESDIIAQYHSLNRDFCSYVFRGSL